MTWNDEVVEQVRRARDEFARRFDYDVARMIADLAAKESLDVARVSHLRPTSPATVRERAVKGPVAAKVQTDC